MTGRPGRFSSLLPWRRLNDILEQARLEFPRIRLSSHGKVIPPESYSRLSTTNRGNSVSQLLVHGIMKHLRTGATLVLSGVDELVPEIRDLATNMERELRIRVSVNAYVAFRDVAGFDAHWDDHDAFVLQVHGRKHWTIHGESRKFPLFRDIPTPDTYMTPSGGSRHTLGAGDALYLPRGYWHSVVSLNEPTLHLTVGFMQPTGIDLMGWLVDRLRAEEIYRNNIPHQHGSPEEQRNHAKSLFRTLEEVWSEDIVNQFNADRNSHAVLRPKFGLPWSASQQTLPPGDDFFVQLLTARAHFCRRETDVELSVEGRQFLLETAAAPILKVLLDGSSHSMFELYREASELPPESIRSLVAQLVQEGILVAFEQSGFRDTQENP